MGRLGGPMGSQIRGSAPAGRRRVLAPAHLPHRHRFTPALLSVAQYVATLHRGFVEGEGGLVYDAAGRVLHLPHHFYTRTQPLQPLPAHTPAEVRHPALGERCRGQGCHWHAASQYCGTSPPAETCLAHPSRAPALPTPQAAAACERHGTLASAIQRYGHMYYHFLLEALPRWVGGWVPGGVAGWRVAGWVAGLWGWMDGSAHSIRLRLRHLAGWRCWRPRGGWAPTPSC